MPIQVRVQRFLKGTRPIGYVTITPPCSAGLRHRTRFGISAGILQLLPRKREQRDIADMAERSVRRRDQADNKGVLRAPFQRLAPGVRIIHHGPGAICAPQSRPDIRLQPYPSAVTTNRLPLDKREESIYTG